MEDSEIKPPLPYLPNEIISHILSKSQLKSLIRLQCVCKQWRSMIQDPDFKLYRGQSRAVAVMQKPRKIGFTVAPITQNLRLEKQFQLKSRFPIINRRSHWSGVSCSCNGLVLFSAGRDIFLWNPATRCTAKVLKLRCLDDNSDIDVVSGLCYDPSTRDYKVVLLIRRTGLSCGYSGGSVIVASLKNKQWRRLRFSYNPYSARDGIEFHGTFHWRVSDYKRRRRHDGRYESYYGSDDGEWDQFSECNKIVYFDPESEEFKELPTPEPMYEGGGVTLKAAPIVEIADNWYYTSQTSGSGENAIVGVGIIDGCLCMARKREKEKTIEVFLMKEYKVKESWVKKFVIPTWEFHPYNDIVLYSAMNKTKVLIWCASHAHLKEMFVYDLKRKKLKNFLEFSVYGNRGGVCPYVESLVSLDEFIWRNELHSHLCMKLG